MKSVSKFKQEDKKQILMLGFAVLTVFIVGTWYLGDNYSLKVWGDEFGYWQSAAYLTGKDWSSVASTNAYYGSGFGVLMAPIMLLFGHDATLMLRASLVVEAALLASCVVAAYLCIDFFSDQIKGTTKVVMAVLPALYPSFILKVNMSEAEIVLVALTWWYTYVALRFIRDKKISQAILITVLSVYSYMVHQRTIHVMLLSVILIVWVYRKKLLNPKLLALAAVLVVGLIAVNIFKSVYVAEMYAHSGGAAMNSNNLSGEGAKVLSILTTGESFKSFLLSLIGKFYYIAVASCMLVVFGIIYVVHSLVNVIQTKQNVERFVGILLVCLNFLGAYLICSISVSNDYVSRSDLMIYGRYMEHAIGPVIILGLLWLYEMADAKIMLGSISATGIAAYVVANTIGLKSSNSNVWRNCTAIADLYESSRYTSAEVLYIALFRTVLFVLFLYLAVTLKNNIKKYMFNIVALCICVLWVTIGFEVVSDSMLSWANDQYFAQRQVLTYIDEGEEFGIYDSYLGGFFQFLRVNDKVHYFANMEDIENITEPMYIISYTKGESADTIRWREDVIMENDLYILWRAYPD